MSKLGFRKDGKPQFEGYKVGDRVWCDFRHIWANIVEVYQDGNLLGFQFEDGETGVIDRTGRYGTLATAEDFAPSFFAQPFEIPAEAFERPKPDLKIDDKVIVWNDTDRSKSKRHFAMWGTDGRIMTWHYGGTSFSTNYFDQFESWDNFEIYKEGE